MKIEQQVVSLKLAKQLKEAGYPQDDSYWSWAISSTIFSCLKCGYEEERLPQLVNTIQCIGPAYSETIAAAPTVAELGEKLPATIKPNVKPFNESYCMLEMVKDEKCWAIQYFQPSSGCQYHQEVATTEADARAKMWLYLKEKGLL
jgi:hypothetical protein